MTVTFTLDNTIVLSKIVVETYSANHIDRGARSAFIPERTLHGYRHDDGTPSCFVGAVLDVAGLLHRVPTSSGDQNVGAKNFVSFLALCQYDPVIGNAFTGEAQSFLVRCQHMQDSFVPWGMVVRHAENDMRWSPPVQHVAYDSISMDKSLWSDVGSVNIDAAPYYAGMQSTFVQTYDPTTMSYKVVGDGKVFWTTAEQAHNPIKVLNPQKGYPVSVDIPMTVAPMSPATQENLYKFLADFAKKNDHDAKMQAETELAAELAKVSTTVDTDTADEKIETPELVTV